MILLVDNIDVVGKTVMLKYWMSTDNTYRSIIRRVIEYDASSELCVFETMINCRSYVGHKNMINKPIDEDEAMKLLSWECLQEKY